MGFAAASFLCLLAITGATIVDDVVSGTQQVIGTLQNESTAAKERFAEPAKFNSELDEIGEQAEAGFDAESYSSKQKAFSAFAHRASAEAKKSVSESNATAAEEKLDEAEEAFKSMNKVGDELDAMEKTFHDKLQAALMAKLTPELKTADRFSGDASHLQHQAHSMMDPLYSWGDASENQADKLNDETNDAESSVDKVVRSYRRNIVDHSRSVQRHAERKLFVGEDRVATWRETNRHVRAATGHLHAQQYRANLDLLGLPLSTGLTVMLTAAAAALVGAATAGFVMKSPNQRSGLYQPLSA